MAGRFWSAASRLAGPQGLHQCFPVHRAPAPGDQDLEQVAGLLGLPGGQRHLLATAVEEARQAVADFITSRPDVQHILLPGFDDVKSVGAIRALEAAGKKIGEDVYVVSVDGGLAGVEGVKAGQIQATSHPCPHRWSVSLRMTLLPLASGGL